MATTRKEKKIRKNEDVHLVTRWKYSIRIWIEVERRE